MARIDNLENFLTDVASAIKEKKGDNTPIPASNFDTEISDIPSVGDKYAPRHVSFYYYGGTDLDSEIANLDTSNITNMKSMFQYCNGLTMLDLSNFNTQNVTKMENMFDSCNKLTTLNLSSFDTTNVSSLYSAFRNCNSLLTLDLSNFNTSKVTRIAYMCYGCLKLSTLDISFDMGKVNDVEKLFGSCTKLTDLTFGSNLGKGYSQRSIYSDYKLDLSPCTLLTHDSLMSVINGLYDLNLTYDVANGGTLYRQQLVLGSTNLAKLTADEIAIATAKGWDVS
jgi:surface protein